MSKKLEKLVDINRLREFKNKLVGTDSAYVQTGAVDQTIAGTKTFSKPIVGSVTGSSGSCTGNAVSATSATYANSSGWADSAGGVAWGNVSDRPWAVSQFTNDSGFITSAVKESSIGDIPGWCLLHGGLLIQWGTWSASTNDFTVNFPKAFSVLPIVVANYGDNVSFGTPCTVDEIFKTAFIVRHSESGSWRVNWIAIGRA